MDLLCCSISLLKVLLLLGPAGQISAINLTNQTALMGGPTSSTTPGTSLSAASLTRPASASSVVEDTASTLPASQDNVVTTLPTSTHSAKGVSPFTENSGVAQFHQPSTSPGDTSSKTPTSTSPTLPKTTSPPQAERPASTPHASAAGPGSTAAPPAPSDTSAKGTPAPSDTSAKGTPPTQTDVPPTQPPDNSLTMVAFGVMSLILILIIVMVVLVTVVNLRGRCNTAKDKGRKVNDSMMSESNMTSNGEKESITLVSIKTINTETDTDSPRVSSVHSTTLDIDDQEFRQELLNSKLV